MLSAKNDGMNVIGHDHKARAINPLRKQALL